MPTRQLVLSAFVASPSDVTEERGLLEEVIGELNVTWSKSLGIRLDLVRWETHTNPSVGLYPQSVINDQIGDDYDLFIGILWSRFGTATPEAKSGTEEEFRRALARRQQLGNVEIMMYFKDAPVAPSQIDLAQMKLVLDLSAVLEKRESITGLSPIAINLANSCEFTSHVSFRVGLPKVMKWLTEAWLIPCR